MNTLVSRKATLFIALVMSIVLFTTAISAQAAYNYRVSFTVKGVITITAKIDTTNETGKIEVRIFGIKVAEGEVSRDQASLDLVNINQFGARLNLNVRVNWRNDTITLSGEACLGGCSNFSRTYSWADGGY